VNVVSAVMKRTYTVDMFDDLNVPPHVRTYVKPVTTLTFDEDLTDEQRAAVWARMESADDGDQARRAELRADRDALPEDDRLRRLYDYLLGDTEGTP
jgi:hypothetical protein